MNPSIHAQPSEAMSRSTLSISLYVFCLLLPAGSVVAQTERANGNANSVLQRFEVRTRQGVAVDEKYFYAISNTRIVKCDKQTGNEITQWQADLDQETFKHFLHLNSGTVIDGKLYCAHSRYSLDPNDNTVEIWNVSDTKLTHEKSIAMPRVHGSLVWIDQRKDGTWWMCYAVYGSDQNQKTRLVRYERNHKSDVEFVELESWEFPNGAR